MTTSLRNLMDHALVDVVAPATILEASIEGGKRLRARRRICGAVAALSLCGAFGATIPLLDAGSGESTSLASHTSRSAPRFEGVPGWWDMPASQMARQVEPLLPAHAKLKSFVHTNIDAAPGQTTAMSGNLSAVLHTRHGLGSLQVMLVQQPVPLPANHGIRYDGTFDLTCPASNLSDGVTQLSCATLLDTATGAVIGRNLEDESHGVIVREVKRLTAGGLVYAAVANSVQRKWGAPASAAKPPLTLDQLATLASSPAWQNYQAAATE